MYKTLIKYFFSSNNLLEKKDNKDNKYNFYNKKYIKISPQMKEIIHLSTLRFINMKIKEEKLRREKEKLLSFLL